MSTDFSSPVKPAMLPEDEMELLQSFLNIMGYNPGPLDGLWGPSTKAAWVLFAQNNGLDQSSVNADTWEAVLSGEARAGYVEGPGGEPVYTQQPDLATSQANDGIITDEEEIYIREQYGSIAYLLDDPEIRSLIELAMAEGYTADRLAIAMEDTEWFQETTANQRTWDATVARDPATAQADVDAQATIIANMADVYGITMSDEQIQEFAFKVKRDGMPNDQMLRYIGNLARLQYTDADATGNGEPSAQLGATKDELARYARSYHLNYSDEILDEWAIRIFEGRWSFDAAEATMRNSARSAYPSLADQLDQGMTLEDFFAPTKNRLAGLLEMNPNDIDLTQERWSPVTQMYNDGDNGFRAMTYAELGQFARSQDEWWKTDTAINNSYNALNGLLDTFGVI